MKTQKQKNLQEQIDTLCKANLRMAVDVEDYKAHIEELNTEIFQLNIQLNRKAKNKRLNYFIKALQRILPFD